MRRTSMIAVIALLALAGCAGGPTAASAAAPIYPYWPIARLPLGPLPVERAPSPVASAVLVAPGYLLTSIEDMGDVMDDFGLDPAVYVFDGTAWHAGRYVDRDKGLRLALIRADVPGTPYRLASRSVPPARMLGIAPLATARGARDQREWRDAPCETLPRWLADDLGGVRTPALCAQMPVTGLPGAALLDEDGALAGIQTYPTGSRRAAGPSAAEIREYLDLYFATWGAAVKPKPAY